MWKRTHSKLTFIFFFTYKPISNNLFLKCEDNSQNIENISVRKLQSIYFHSVLCPRRPLSVGHFFSSFVNHRCCWTTNEKLQPSQKRKWYVSHSSHTQLNDRKLEIHFSVTRVSTHEHQHWEHCFSTQSY